ncbi:MAG: tyrosine-type recombinase/integrase [Oscillospiraceae bacterium]|nr:tyrosine-type recombinase/integrase [Oscillospiraceae bacterium]
MENGLQITAAGIQAPIQTGTAITEELGRQFVGFIDAAPQSVNTYRASIRRMIEHFKAAAITRPTRANMLQYRDTLKAQYKPASVALHMTAARLFFRWTAQQGYYPNIADHVKGAKLDRGHKKDYLTSGQVKAVFQTADRATLTGKRDYAIIALMVTGGIRCIEASRANIEDLRTAGDSAALYIQGKGKEEKADYVKLAAPVEKAIRDYLRARGETDGSAPLFASDSNNSKGARITPRSISRLVKCHMTEAGYNSDRLTAHSLRHTAATLNLLNGGTPEETQQLLRHTNINTTLIYCHALERAKNNSESRIAAAVF